MELRSLDAARNRNRRYALSIQYRVDGGAELLIAWGRVGKRPRVRVEAFESFTDLQRRHAALLARRRSHGYEEVATADVHAPPLIPIPFSGPLTLDRTTRFTPMRQANGHLGIFDSHQHGFLVRNVDPGVAPLLTQTLNASPDPNPCLALDRLFSQAA